MNVAAERLGLLPPYLFAELDRKKREIEKSGRRVISFTIGDPDLPTPEPIIRACQRALERPENHRYPDYAGSRSFREAAARWMKRRFGIELDPDGQVAALIGSKEGIAHTAWACVNPGDVVLCPDPAYPVYANSALLSGGK
ncbi:MAG: aminotransferase class I/II-fold pyridoxal phosphate-dependent enzyme, partial [Deltaproteobacteria bacterium]